MNCRFLDAFLSNPSRESFEFRRPSDEITHLQNRLGDEIRAGSLQVSADRSGSPHGLLVKKTTKAYDDEVRAWRHRCSKIKQIINSIGLGAGYGSIMSLKPIPPETMRNPASSQVIDLTGNPTVSQADTPTAPRLNSASTPVSGPSQLDNSRAGITAGQASSTENTTRIQNVSASAIVLPAPNTPSGQRPSQPRALASSSTSNVLLPPTKRRHSQTAGVAGYENDTIPRETDQKHAKRPRVAEGVAEGSPETSLLPIINVLQSGTSLGAIEAPLPALLHKSVDPLVRSFPGMPWQ